MREYRHVVTKPAHLILVDYDRPVFAHRLWLIETKSKKVVLRSRVSQAFLTGIVRPGRFSNRPNSHLSCTGAFMTDDSYHGEFGYSMRVVGLQAGINDNALNRAIVFHSHWFIFWSGGCFVTPAAVNRQLIDRTANGTFFYVHRTKR